MSLQQHHGVCVCGPSVAEAFAPRLLDPFRGSETAAEDDLYYLEQASKVQVMAMSTQQKLLVVSDEVAQSTKSLERSGRLSARPGKSSTA